MKKARKFAAICSAAAMAVSMLGLTASAEENTEVSIQDMISSMTVEQKVEQMMMITLRPWSDGTEGSTTTNVTELNDELRSFIEQHNFAGVCLFAPNIHDTAQCVSFTDEIQQAALKSECGIPMLISADQEGGKIYRLQTGTPTCGNMALGATGDPSLAYENAGILGREIKALGINTDLAPDIDVNNNPANPIINLRSFSSDPQIVSDMCTQYIRGLQDAQVITTVKHYPGHGDTGTDSHTGLPLVDKSYDELKKTELYPYTAAVEAGTDMVMTAHIQFPQLETGTYTSTSTGEEINLPATLSKTIVTDVLRGDYGFEGVVITDSLVMGAITQNFDMVDVATLAMNADVDILLEPMTIASPQQITEMEQYIEDVAQQVKDGKIPEETVNKSVERILTMKESRGILDYTAPDADEALEIVGSSEHREKALEIAEKAVTLVKNSDRTLPLHLGESGKVAYFYGYENVGNTMTYTLDRLKKDQLLAEGVTAECICFKGHTASEYEENVKNSDAVIIAGEMYSINTLNPNNTASGWQSAFTDDLIALAHKYDKKVVYLSAHIPYDVARYTDADAIVAAYCANGMDALPVDGQENPAYGVNYPAALITIFGFNQATGKLPVDVYKIDENYQYTDEILYPIGHGLSYVPEVDADTQERFSGFVKQEYQKQTGTEPAGVTSYQKDGTLDLVITMTDASGAVLDVYTIDCLTLKGTDQAGNAVDLSSYMLTEEDCFATIDRMGELGAIYCREQTGSKASEKSVEVDLIYEIATITLKDDAGNTIAEYNVNARTGAGRDASGNEVDLGTFAEMSLLPEDAPEFFTTLKKMGDMAVIDYEKKFGVACYCMGIELHEDGTLVDLTLTNANGETLAVYTVNPITGEGASNDGSAVNLPQTGNNAVGTAAAAGGALMLTVSGLFAVLKSSVLRKKEEQDF